MEDITQVDKNVKYSLNQGDEMFIVSVVTLVTM